MPNPAGETMIFSTRFTIKLNVVKFPFDKYFPKFLERNPLSKLEVLSLSDERGAKISLDTLKMLSDLPSINFLFFKPDWNSFTTEEFVLLLVYGCKNKYEIKYELLDFDEDEEHSDDDDIEDVDDEVISSDEEGDNDDDYETQESSEDDDDILYEILKMLIGK